MEKKTLIERIKGNKKLKRFVLNFVIHPVKTRPQWWIRIFQFAYLKRGKHSVIYRSVRKDLVPFNLFILGNYSVVEDFSCLNNAVGDIRIGNRTRIGLGNTIIGPVKIGNDVNLGQNIVVSGLNHNYERIDKPISRQGITTKPIIIENDVWIGANSVITAGVTIGHHSVVAAGSVVTHSIPPFSICGGTPARIIKQYDSRSKGWKRV